MANKYEQGLDKNAANYVPLSPLTFLRRSAAVYPNHQAIVHGISAIPTVKLMTGHASSPANLRPKAFAKTTL